MSVVAELGPSRAPVGRVTGFDVIGDVHGHADALHRLLSAMGYSEKEGIYRHPERRAVFLGDFVDRGPAQREVLRVGKAMVQAGSALAVMGNHEFNAIAYATSDGHGGYLRPHTDSNKHQHSAFLDQIGSDPRAHADAVDWFMTLPLWLDLGGLRVVHACWHPPSQEALSGALDSQNRLTPDSLPEIHRRGTPAYAAAEVLLKGPEAKLPSGHVFRDKDGIERREARLRWWDPGATTFRSAALGMEGREAGLPEDAIAMGFLYESREPVLFGHYWMRGEPHLLSARASCLDFSVAKGGFLTAYRWSGEQELRAENLVWVPAHPSGETATSDETLLQT